MTAKFVKACPRYDLLPASDLPEVAFAGRSNCGKSSLINAFTGHKSLARTSGKPGRTRELVYFSVVWPGKPQFHLVDLPGYGYAKVSFSERDAWDRLITAYIEKRAQLKLMLVLHDVRRSAQQEEQQLIAWCDQRGIRSLLVLTKGDKIPKNRRLGAIKALQKGLGLKQAPLLTSVPDRLGIDQLRDAVTAHLEQLLVASEQEVSTQSEHGDEQ
jgi:GTP-binding protein